MGRVIRGLYELITGVLELRSAANLYCNGPRRRCRKLRGRHRGVGKYGGQVPGAGVEAPARRVEHGRGWKITGGRKMWCGITLANTVLHWIWIEFSVVLMSELSLYELDRSLETF